MEKNHNFIQIKVDGKGKSHYTEVEKTFKQRINVNKTVIVYNRFFLWKTKLFESKLYQSVLLQMVKKM